MSDRDGVGVDDPPLASPHRIPESRQSVSVVVPIYNEAPVLRQLLDRLVAVAHQLEADYEFSFVFVDDGSADDSLRVIRDLAVREPRLHVVQLRRHYGQTAALQTGFDHAAGTIVVSMDADLQHFPEDIPRLLDRMNEGYDGVLVRDGWAPYRRFTAAGHQTCVAHLLRRCRDLMRDHPRAPFAARVKALLQQALGIRDRRAAGTMSPHGAAVARGHVLNQLFTALDQAGRLPAMQRFAAHLRTELPALLSFLFDPSVDATNWRAEHALRPAVVNRKVCGGNRSARGAATQHVLTSVLRTAQQRQLDASAVLVELLRAPQPTVSQTLALPTSDSPR